VHIDHEHLEIPDHGLSWQSKPGTSTCPQAQEDEWPHRGRDPCQCGPCGIHFRPRCPVAQNDKDVRPRNRAGHGLISALRLTFLRIGRTLHRRPESPCWPDITSQSVRPLATGQSTFHTYRVGDLAPCEYSAHRRSTHPA
jgi:hypothetical protein